MTSTPEVMDGNARVISESSQGVGSVELMGRYSKLDIATKLRSILAGGGREDPPARTTRSVRHLRRLNDVEVDDLVTRYQSGERIADLARDFGMHRTTISAQLTARGCWYRHAGSLPRRNPRWSAATKLDGRWLELLSTSGLAKVSSSAY